jgi:phosphohistidine swiveling domain-containing protein
MATTATGPHVSGDPPAGPLPTPPDFPVRWEQPGDERLFWTLDRMHFPDPITPMADSFIHVFLEEGFGTAFARYAIPARMSTRRINTYHYESTAPAHLSPEESEALGQRSEEQFGAVMAVLDETWRREWLPAIKQRLAAWERFDLRQATLPALRAELDATMARHRELAAIHFQIVLPSMLPMSLFQDLYRDLFADDDPFSAHRLLQGLDNETLRANRDLWHLSRRALAAPSVRRVLNDRPSGAVVAALDGTDEGRAFLVALRAYLDEHGRRGSDFFDLDRPSWLEDPTPVIDNLKGYISNPDYDPVAQEANLAAERERLLTAARERLQGYPQQVRGQFEHLLKAAQEGAVLTEDHGYYIDWQGGYRIRMVLLECGRRLAAGGVIAAPDDLFLLTFEEVRDVLSSPTGTDLRPLVTERRAEMAHFRRVSPPPALGTPPPGAPPDNPVMRTNQRFFGGPPPVAQEPGIVRGNAGSPGKVTGRAVVIRSLAEAGRLRQGDILVAETTAPPWTPLFATVAAVVTDTGGILSHSAVVAREYRIPAVVGTGAATRLIRDGQRVEVDGDAGLVRLLDADA